VDDDASIIVGLAPTLLVVFDAVIAQVIDRHTYTRQSRTQSPARRTWCVSALYEDRSLFAFAGVWTEFKGD
jgi:hypothetical protein